jgi:hypothetical protein
MGADQPAVTGQPVSTTGSFTGGQLAAFALLVCLYVATRLWQLTAACLWFDEIFSLHAARHEWGPLLAFAAADVVHPPLFYLLLKGWVKLGGESLVWLRLLPALAAIAALVPFALLCRELRLAATETNLALALISVNGYLVHYAQTLRMYSLLLLLGLGSLWLFLRFVRAGSDQLRSLLYLTAVNLLLIYTHYYGWFIIGAQAFFLLLFARGRLRPFAVAVAALALAFSPWAYAVARAARNGALAQNLGWVRRPKAFDLADLFMSLDALPHFPQSAAAGLALFNLPILLWVWRRAKAGDRPAANQHAAFSSLATFAFAPALLAFSASQLLPQSIWGSRHLILIAVPYLMLAATAINRLRPDWARISMFILIICWLFLASSLLLIKKEPSYIWCAWDPLVRQMIRVAPPAADEIKIYAFEDLIAYHIWFTLDSTGEKRFRVVRVRGVTEIAEDAQYFLPRGFDGVTVADPGALSGDHFWVAFRDASWDPGRQPLKLLADRGYQIEERLSISAPGQNAFLVQVTRKGE